jgi:N-acetylmuramoyl-L-alanine amidase
MRRREADGVMGRCPRVPASPCPPVSASRCLLPLLLILASLISGCEQAVVAPPYPASPPPAAYSPSVTAPGQPAEVVEKSLGYLGGPRTIFHEVGPMETVWRISRMYDVSPESICSANRLKPGDSLQIGQKLIVPNAAMIRHVINLYRNPQWKYIVIHHTATWKGSARTINRTHGDRGFWNGLGYHFLIDNGTLWKGDGQIEMSPRWIRQQSGAHCKACDMNARAVGIALVGNFNYEKPTPNQLQSLSFLLSVLARYYGLPCANILAHGQVPGAKTECPGRLFPMDYLRQTPPG